MNQVSRNQLSLALGAVLLLSCLSCARRVHQASAAIPGDPPFSHLSPAVHVSAADADAAEPAIAIAPDESVYVAWVEHHANNQADVMIAHLSNDQKLQGSPIRVNPQPGMATAWRGDPPTLAVAPDNTVYVGWTARADSPSGHATNVYLSASNDLGQTFRAPVKVNDDAKPAVHGMHSLGVARDGRVYVAWLDERNVAMPQPSQKAEGHHMESNREVFLASSADGGRTFSTNSRVAANACPCCKTALAINADGRVYVSWRQVLPGDLRHIAIASSTNQGKTFSPAVIVSDDQWVLAGCPVSGSAVSTGEHGVLRVLWYSAGKNGQTGLYWSESHDSGATFAPRQLVAAESARGTPVLLAQGEKIAAIWQVSDNGRAQLRLAPLAPGASVSNSQIVTSAGELPAAAMIGGKVCLSYLTESEGRRSVWLLSAD